jgi:hypothetical protein
MVASEAINPLASSPLVRESVIEKSLGKALPTSQAPTIWTRITSLPTKADERFVNGVVEAVLAEAAAERVLNLFTKDYPQPSGTFRRFAQEAANLRKELRSLQAHFGHVELALRLGLSELKRYFGLTARVITKLLDHQEEEDTKYYCRLLSAVLLGIVRTNLPSVPVLSRSDLADIYFARFATLLKRYPQDASTGKTDLDVALDILAENPMLLSRLPYSFPHEGFFSCDEEFLVWIYRTFDTIDRFTPASHSEQTTLREVHFRYSRPFIKILCHLNRQPEAQKFFKNAAVACREKSAGLWDEAFLNKWAFDYLNCLEGPLSAEFALVVCTEMFALWQPTGMTSDWAEKLFTLARQAGDNELADSVRSDVFAAISDMDQTASVDSWTVQTLRDVWAFKLREEVGGQAGREMAENMVDRLLRWIQEQPLTYMQKVHSMDALLPWAKELEKLIMDSEDNAQARDSILKKLYEDMESALIKIKVPLYIVKPWTEKLNPWRDEEQKLKHEVLAEMSRVKEGRALEMTIVGSRPSLPSIWDIRSYTATSRELHRVGGAMTNGVLASLGCDIEDLARTSCLARLGISMFCDRAPVITRMGVPVGRLLGSCSVVIDFSM